MTVEKLKIWRNCRTNGRIWGKRKKSEGTKIKKKTKPNHPPPSPFLKKKNPQRGKGETKPLLEAGGEWGGKKKPPEGGEKGEEKKMKQAQKLTLCGNG